MYLLKKIGIWMMGIAAIPFMIILVWLFTFMSFNVLVALRSPMTIMFEAIITLIWGLVVVSLGNKDVDEIMS